MLRRAARTSRTGRSPSASSSASASSVRYIEQFEEVAAGSCPGAGLRRGGLRPHPPRQPAADRRHALLQYRGLGRILFGADREPGRRAAAAAVAAAAPVCRRAAGDGAVRTPRENRHRDRRLGAANQRCSHHAQGHRRDPRPDSDTKSASSRRRACAASRARAIRKSAWPCAPGAHIARETEVASGRTRSTSRPKGPLGARDAPLLPRHARALHDLLPHALPGVPAGPLADSAQRQLRLAAPLPRRGRTHLRQQPQPARRSSLRAASSTAPVAARRGSDALSARGPQHPRARRVCRARSWRTWGAWRSRRTSTPSCA